MKKGFVLLLAFAFVCIVFAEDESEKCTRTDSWFDGCNTCSCTEDGRTACTRKACEPRTLEPLVEYKEIPESCTPGISFKVECNNCGCTEDGEPFCTRKLCRSPRKIVLG